MHPADRRLALPAMFAGLDRFARHPEEHLRPDSRDERLAIEAGAYAEAVARDSTGRTSPAPTTSVPRPQPARDPIGS